jgi:hypothetical protein
MSFLGTWLTVAGYTAKISDRNSNGNWTGYIIFPFISPQMEWDSQGNSVGTDMPEYDLIERISERAEK